MPSGIELYGITDGLDATTISRLESGFDKIRAYEHWEDFRIPSFVWDWVTEANRDRILDIITTVIYDTRMDSSYTPDPDFDHDLFFAWTYFWCILVEWWGSLNHEWIYSGVTLYEDIIYYTGIPITSETGDDTGIETNWASIDYLGMVYANPPTGKQYKNTMIDFEGSYYDQEASVSVYYADSNIDDAFEYERDGIEEPGKNRWRDILESGYTYTNLDPIAFTGNPADWTSAGYEFQGFRDPSITPLELSRLEKYGNTYGLDYEVYARLVSGMDKIRAKDDWVNFKIPTYVWTYINQLERDRIIGFLYDTFFVRRDTSDYYYDESYGDTLDLEVEFAYRYVMALFVEWWRDGGHVYRTSYLNPWPIIETVLFQQWGHNKKVSQIINCYSSWYDVDEGFVEVFFNGPLKDIEWQMLFFLDWWEDGPNVSFWGFIEAGYGYASYGGYSTLTTAFVDVEVGPDIEDASWNYMWDKYFGYDAYFEAPTDYEDTWNDEKVEETWAGWYYEIRNGLYINGEYPVLGGSLNYRTFGGLEGVIDSAYAVVEGEWVTIAWYTDNEEDYVLGKAKVVSTTYDVVTGVSSLRIADPVTAGGGQAIYSAGYAIYALEEAIEYYDGTVVIDPVLIPSETFPEDPDSSWSSEHVTVYLNPEEDPPDFWQFARNVCYGLNAVLRFGRDGKYYIDNAPDSHSISPAQVIADDSPIIDDRPNDYANKVMVVIDDSWYTVATEYTTEHYSTGGASVSIRRLGERIDKISTDLGEGEGEENYAYNEEGFLTRKVEDFEQGDSKHYKETVWHGITDENNYDVKEVTRTYAWEQWMTHSGTTPVFHSGWIEQNRTEIEWSVNLEGASKFTHTDYSLDPPGGATVNNSSEGTAYIIGFSEEDWHDWPYLWPKEQWKGTVVTNPEAGPINGFAAAEHYTYGVVGLYLPTGSSFPAAKLGWRKAHDNSARVGSPPKLEKYAAEELNEVHLQAEASDQRSIDFLGEYPYETTAVALDSEEGIVNYALGVLQEKARVRHAKASIALNSTIQSHDVVSWGGISWFVKGVHIDLGSGSEDLDLSAESCLYRLKGSLPKEPVTVVEDIKNAIVKRSGLYHNICRGKILSRRGHRRYTVKVDNKTEAVTARALDGSPHTVGATVLLGRPTGRKNQWMVLGHTNEQEIQTFNVAEDVTPEIDSSFGLDNFKASSYITNPIETIYLGWNYVLDPTDFTSLGVTLDLGDGSEPYDIEGYENPKIVEVRLLTIGEITPTITLWAEKAGERITGEAKPLERPIIVEEPDFGDFFTIPSVLRKDESEPLEIQLPIGSAELPELYVGVNHGDGSGDGEGYFYYTVDTNSYHTHNWIWTDVSSNIDVKGRILWTQANGEPWQQEYDLHTFYAFPIGGALDFSNASIPTSYYSLWYINNGNPIREISGERIGVGGYYTDWELTFKVKAGESQGAPNNLYKGDLVEVVLHGGKKYRPEAYGNTSYPSYGYDQAYTMIRLKVEDISAETSRVWAYLQQMRVEFYGHRNWWHTYGQGVVYETNPGSIAEKEVRVVHTADEDTKLYFNGALICSTSGSATPYRLFPWIAWEDKITAPVYMSHSVRTWNGYSGMVASTVQKDILTYIKGHDTDEDGKIDTYCGWLAPYDITLTIPEILVRDDKIGIYNIPGADSEFSYTKP